MLIVLTYENDTYEINHEKAIGAPAGRALEVRLAVRPSCTEGGEADFSGQISGVGHRISDVVYLVDLALLQELSTCEKGTFQK